MNEDLISREALKKVFNGYYSGIGSWPKFTLGACLQLIDNAPAVITCEVCKNKGNERECVDCHDYSCFVHYEPRPQGEWNDIYESHIAYECSNCKMQMPISERYFHFCPNCGAAMQKGGAE